MSGFLDAFREAYMRTNVSFNAHDFDAAFASMADDIEWHHFAENVETQTMVGRDQVRAFFEEILEEFPDWTVEPLEFDEAEPGVAIVHCLASATGRASGLMLQRPFSQVWDVRPGKPVTVREYTDRDDARAAAGLAS
jgi:ketosteroid isomerase-like protein